MNVIVDRYNMCVGALVAVLSIVFGAYWYLFAGYLLLNLIDWLTGWHRSRIQHRESSAVGLKGILKKAGYWAIIVVTFTLSDIMIRLGDDILGVRFDFLTLFGWLTLANLTVNEARSIVENLVECGYEVPEFIVRGLAVADRLINARTEADIPKSDGGEE